MDDFLPLLRNAHISKLKNKTEAGFESPFFLNLTVADTVFIFEPWWNKVAEE